MHLPVGCGGVIKKNTLSEDITKNNGIKRKYNVALH